MTENVQKQFNELTVQELKALAYDNLATLEMAQNNLKTINARISELVNPNAESSQDNKTE